MPQGISPLARLTELLQGGPRSLTMLLQMLSNADDYKDFIKIVKEFLPEQERELMTITHPAEQLVRFCEIFSKAYFPLNGDWFDMGEAGYSELISFMPLIVEGIGWEDYDEIAQCDDVPHLLLTYLCEDPYRGGDARAALGDALIKESISRELLRRVPENGLGHDDAVRIFKGTKFEAVAIWSQRLHMCTNTYIFDNDDEILHSGGGLPEWTRKDIDEMTNDYRWSCLMTDSLNKLWDKLKANPEATFSKILNFMEKGLKAKPVPAEPKTLAETFAEGGDDGEEEGECSPGLTIIP